MIDIEKMRASLMSIDKLREKLAITEHLSEYEFDTDKPEAVFNYPDNWVQESGGPKADDMTPSTVTVSVKGTEFPLTRGAALEAASIMGIQKSYALATPGSLITPHVNYWYSHSKKNLKLLAGQNGVAFVRGTINPFSNDEILGVVLEGIQEKYNSSDVLADYKFTHSLDKTKMRLIVPASQREIMSARHGATDPDAWNIGLEITNSVTGDSPLEVNGYLFSYWCTNGCTTTHVTSGKYRRKPTAKAEDAYDWAKNVVDEVLGGMEAELDRVEHLTQIPLEGELNDTLGQMFNQFGVPANLRSRVLENLAESSDLTAYGLLNSITAAANDPELSASGVSALLNAGGQVANAMENRCGTCHSILSHAH